MADPLLAQSAIDRLQSAAHELVLEGDSYRQRGKSHPRRHPAGNHRPPTTAVLTGAGTAPASSTRRRRQTPNPVPSHWRNGGPLLVADDNR